MKLDNARFDSLVAKISEMTDNNYHTEALIVGAQFLGLYALCEKLVHVQALWKLEGRMPHHLGQYRDTLMNDLFTEAKKRLTEDQYSSFHGAY